MINTVAMNIEQEIQNILDRNFTRGDNANALKELLVLSNLSARNWAKMREDACRVREKVAINFMLDIYCDVDVTEELQKEAYKDFKKRYEC